MDRKLLSYLQREIFMKNDWILWLQQPNGPIANVQNCCIFPAMAKHISKLHAFKVSRKVLDLDRIDKFVQKFFFYFKKSMLGKTYVHHKQVVQVMYWYEGG